MEEPIGYDNHSNDSRVTEADGVYQTITKQCGTGGNNVPLVEQAHPIRQTTAHGDDVFPTLNGTTGSCPNYQDDQAGAYVMKAVDLYNGKITGDVACTLTHHTEGVGSGPYAMQQEPIGFKAGQSANGGIGVEEGVSPTINAQMPALEPTVLFRSIVRRLTPLECERLMGLPDFYTLVPTKKWRKAYDGEKDFVLSHKPEYEPYFKEVKGVMKTCLSADGPRYKACGNGWATNQPRWIFKRIDQFNTKMSLSGYLLDIINSL